MYILVDGFAVGYKAWYSCKLKDVIEELPVKDVLRNLIPSFLSILGNVVFKVDAGSPLFSQVVICWEGKNAVKKRREFFDGYKRGRVRKGGLKVYKYFDDLREILGDVNNRYSLNYVDAEADDLLAVFCDVVRDVDRCVVSNDSDLFQLVGDGVSLMDLNDYSVYDENGVYAKVGVMPKDIVMFKALAGDSSDGWKGVKGVGEMTARSILSVENSGRAEELCENVGVKEFIKIAKLPFCELNIIDIMNKVGDLDYSGEVDWGSFCDKWNFDESLSHKVKRIV